MGLKNSKSFLWYLTCFYLSWQKVVGLGTNGFFPRQICRWWRNRTE